MKETVISWTFVNWVTVVLMFLVAAGIFSLALKAWTAVKAQNAGS